MKSKRTKSKKPSPRKTKYKKPSLRKQYKKPSLRKQCPRKPSQGKLKTMAVVIDMTEQTRA